jgi:hypothetical protein
MQKRRPARSQKRGSVLLLVLFILVVLAMMGTTLTILLPVEMRNAQKDRANVQTAYAADAAVLHVMGELEDARNQAALDSLTGHTASLSNGWEYRVVSVEELPNEVDAFRVVTEGIQKRGNRRTVLRRAVAIIDNGIEGGQATLLVSSASPNGTGAMGSTQHTYWPGNVPIKGDVLVSGHWAVDDTKFNLGNGQPFTGVVRQTVAGGNGLRGESYLGSPVAANDYGDVYTNGLAGVETVDPNELPDAMFLAVNATRQRVQEYLFDTSDTTKIDALNTVTKGAPGLYIPLDSTGVPNGGIVFNGGDYDIVFSVDGNGDSVMTMTGGSAALPVKTVKGSDPTPVPVAAGAVTAGGVLTVTHQTSGGQDRLIVRDGNGIVYQSSASFGSTGSVIFSHGSLSARGTYAGNKTVAAGGGMSITGEILKKGLTRGDAPTNSSHLLGLIANLNPQNSSEGFRMDISSPTADKQYHVYASMMALAKTDVNTKFFGHNLHGNIPNGSKFHFYGQLASGPSNNGQFKKEIEFIEDKVAQLVQDELPLGWPTSAVSFRSRLRAYVDQQVNRND